MVGSVGSGKSTLLSALLGEMSKRAGRVELRGRVALCTQQPWLITGTLKENVLFGLPYDDEKFWRTLEVRPIPRVSLCSNLYCCPRSTWITFPSVDNSAFEKSDSDRFD